MAGMTMEELLAGVPPEQRGEMLAKWMSLGGLQDKDAMLREQMAQAQALLNAPTRQYDTWGGALAGGIGDVIGKIRNRGDYDRLAAEQAKNAAETQNIRGTFPTAYFPTSAPPSGIPQMVRAPRPQDPSYALPLMFGGA